MAIIVSDTSPIPALAHLELLAVLKGLFEQVVVPPAVDTELLHPPIGLPPVDVRTLDFASIQAPRNLERVQKLLETLDPGESEAMALALELGALAILFDESAGRAMAKRLGLLPIGVLGTLVRAKQRGLIGTVATQIDRLERELGFFISMSLRVEILTSAGEVQPHSLSENHSGALGQMEQPRFSCTTHSFRAIVVNVGMLPSGTEQR